MRFPIPLPAVLGLCCALTASSPAQPAAAPPPAAVAAKPLEAAERRMVLETLAKEIESLFVFPDVATAYARMLRAAAEKGAYESLTDPRAFADRVTSDLQAVSKDGHLRLMPADAMRGVPGHPTPGGGPMPRMPQGGLDEAKMIGDVAYLRFSLFPEDEKVAAAARDFLLAHADARAVIIDSRTNRGGTLRIMDAILPLLYAEPTTLLRMDTRADAPEVENFVSTPTLVRQPSPGTVVRRDHVVKPDEKERRLQKVPVFYLTSKRTGSAAEHLALAFQRTGRATLIGETTGGAGHYGGIAPIGERFAAFIPVGRSYDADTNRGWEGTGVSPTIEIAADKALDEALRRAQVPAGGRKAG